MNEEVNERIKDFIEVKDMVPCLPLLRKDVEALYKELEAIKQNEKNTTKKGK